MSIANNLVKLIDADIAKNHEEKHRWHLGASLMGRECARELWYKFRWHTARQPEGRMLRLYRRGHREEEVFIADLRQVGAAVFERDPATGKQYRMSDCFGHFGGSLDGIGINIPLLPDEPILLEFKTYAAKYFSQLKKQGLLKYSWTHYVQMQLYMGKYGLKYGLYMAVNKDNDERWADLIEFDEKTYHRYKERSSMIIASDVPLPRINEKPGWFKCKMCDEHGVCHSGEAPDINCRTCAHSAPVLEGNGARWSCAKKQLQIYYEEGQLQGCKHHIFNPVYNEQIEIVADDFESNWLEINHPDHGIIRLGPDYITSEMYQLICTGDEIDYWYHPESDCYGVDPKGLIETGSEPVDFLEKDDWLKRVSKLHEAAQLSD